MEERVESSYRVFYDGKSAYFTSLEPARDYYDCLIGQVDDLRFYLEVRDIDSNDLVRSALIKKERAYHGQEEETCWNKAYAQLYETATTRCGDLA